MTLAPTAAEYRNQLRELLRQCDTSLSVEQQHALRALVRERRNGRRRPTQASASDAVDKQANAIVLLLESAGRVLRPRETQELDDLVAGREKAEPKPAPYGPVRLRRRGTS
jgi:hypothetical protein